MRITVDPERYQPCLALAQKLGPISNARKVYELLYATLAAEDQEVFHVVLCDVRGQLRGISEIGRGQRSRVGVGLTDLMRIVRKAQDEILDSGAELFITAHNHPSGVPTPSDADRQLTSRIQEITRPYAEGGELTFADHVIVGRGAYYSMAEPAKGGRPTWKGKLFKY